MLTQLLVIARLTCHPPLPPRPPGHLNNLEHVFTER